MEKVRPSTVWPYNRRIEDGCRTYIARWLANTGSRHTHTPLSHLLIAHTSRACYLLLPLLLVVAVGDQQIDMQSALASGTFRTHYYTLRSWSINAFCAMVKAFSLIPKCQNTMHNIQPYQSELRTRNHPSLQGCFGGMPLTGLPVPI